MAGPGQYQLARRNRGGLVLGMPAPQAALVATGLAIMLGLAMVTHSLPGFMVGAGAAVLCAGIAFVPVDGQPSHLIIPALVRYLGSRIDGSGRWLAPLQPTIPGPGSGSDAAHIQRPPSGPAASHTRNPGRGQRRAEARQWPRCLAGLQILGEARPAWAGTVDAPIGLARGGRTGQVTIVLPVRGGAFSLQDNETQHAQLAAWGQVLTQFGRESSPVVRLGWSLWSSPGMASDHLDWLQPQLSAGRPHTGHSGSAGHRMVGPELHPGRGPQQQAERDYWEVLQQQAPALYQHELRVWITIDTRQTPGRRSTRAQVALGAGQALAERCAAAGLLVGPALSPLQLADALRAQADPQAHPGRRRTRIGLAQRAGLLGPVPALPAPRSIPPAPGGMVTAAAAAPLAVQTHWDAVQIDGSWHRTFWVAHWPATVSDPRWLEPLLLNPVGTRAITMAHEPISPRASRRRITADAVALDSQLQLRDKHEFRVPVHLRAAHDEIDQREAELSAGYTEYGHYTLITVTAPTLDDLDRDSQVLLDQAAQCGITELRPLHGRHDAAWACTLPIGRAPNRELMNGAGL